MANSPAPLDKQTAHRHPVTLSPGHPVTQSPWVPHQAIIRSIKKEVPGIQTYELEFADAETADRFRFQPGQFNMLYLPGIGEAAISISTDPRLNQRLGHTIRAAGNLTQALARREPGSKIGIRGPFGSSWPLHQCKGQDIVIAAGGVGLAPLRPAIYHIHEPPRRLRPGDPALRGARSGRSAVLR